MGRSVAVVSPTGSLGTLIEDYLASCRARGLSRGTIEKNYGYSLRQVFLPWATERGVNDPGQLDQRLLDRFTADLYDHSADHPLSKDTIHSYLRPVRQLLRWARSQGDISTEAMPQLPRLGRRVIDVLTRDEINRLEDAAQAERDKLMIRLLADTGIRSGELCGLRVSSVGRLERGYFLKVHGKGNKERLVPLRPELARRIERFAKSRPAGIQTDRLFCSLRRRGGGDYPPITGSGVGQMLDDTAERAGIEKRVYPHLLRHSFATEALRRGMNPVQLAQILGHSGLQMIDRVYSHLTTSDAHDALMRMLSEA